jgi:hypothetical protein
MIHHELLAHVAQRRGNARRCTDCRTANHPCELQCYKCGGRLEEDRRSDEVSAAGASASLTPLIKRLVEKLQSVEKDTEYQIHHIGTVPYPEPLILEDDERCPCALCAGLEWLDNHGGSNG